MADYRDRESRHSSYSDSRSKNDDPPNSRLFIVCSKTHEEDDMRNAFDKFGHIEDIWVIKNRVTGENKGVTYIKYSKTTEAAYALEEMNGKVIGSSSRPIKVMIASNRDQGNQNDPNEGERWVRLFCILPKSMKEEELENEFIRFGPIEYVTVVKDRATNESKGFGYVKFKKISSAAKAFEECDKKFKAVFAAPKKSKFDFHNDAKYHSLENNLSSYNYASTMHKNSVIQEIGKWPNPDGFTRLLVACPDVNLEQMRRLFDLMPGMESFDYKPEYHTSDDRSRMPMGQITITYKSPHVAAYAFEKLNNFEYIPGQRLTIVPERSGIRSQQSASVVQELSVLNNLSSNQDLTQSELRNVASSLMRLMERAGIVLPRSDTNQDLPDPQQMASIDAPVAKRCYIVISPPIPPMYIIKDAFQRFGNLIDVYLVRGQNFGFAKYATEESADEAIKVLHGKDINGSRIKVLEAVERDTDQIGNDRKRMRMDNGTN